MKISFYLGKNGCHMPSDLGGRLIVMVNWKSRFKLLEWIHCDINFVPTDLRLIFGANAIVVQLFIVAIF